MRTDNGKTIYMERGINGHAHSEEVSNGNYVVVIDDATADGYEVSIIYDQKGELQGYVSSATDGAYPADGVSGNVCLSKRSPSFSLKVHQDQPVQSVFLSITDRERFRHFDKAAA